MLLVSDEDGQVKHIDLRATSRDLDEFTGGNSSASVSLYELFPSTGVGLRIARAVHLACTYQCGIRYGMAAE